MQTVNHKQFGIGEVIAKRVVKDDIEIVVRFSDGVEKTFSTAAFESKKVEALDDFKEEIECIINGKNAVQAARRAVALAAINAHRNAAGAPQGNPRAGLTNKITLDFEDYLIKEGYSKVTPSGHPSTVYSYIGAIERHVLGGEGITWDDLMRDIDNVIKIYGAGGAKELIGAKSNSTVIDALKSFKRFVNTPKP